MYSWVAAMPLAGEHVTDTSALGGSSAIASSIDFIGTSSKCRLRTSSRIAGDDSTSRFGDPNGQNLLNRSITRRSLRILWQTSRQLSS